MTIYAVVNNKGGVSKTSTTQNLAHALVKKGFKVLVIDCDPQASLTLLLGNSQPDKLNYTLGEILLNESQDQSYNINDYIRNVDGLDYIAANIGLMGVEQQMMNATSREYFIKDVISKISRRYDYIILDSSPSLGLLTINILTAADKLIIPIIADFLSIKGLELLLSNYKNVRRRLNPDLMIEGILLSQYNPKLKNTREIENILTQLTEGSIKIFQTRIPQSVKAKEANFAQKSILDYAQKSNLAKAFVILADELTTTA
jgi:chromosome partitioning protein